MASTRCEEYQKLMFWRLTRYPGNWLYGGKVIALGWETRGFAAKSEIYFSSSPVLLFPSRFSRI